MVLPAEFLVSINISLSFIRTNRDALDAHESEVYLSDAQGRRVTPRVTAEPSSTSLKFPNVANKAPSAPTPRGRGQPPKIHAQAQEAREAQNQAIAHKKRIGAPGIDRGGSTFINEKRRRGFSDDDQPEEEFVDAGD